MCYHIGVKMMKSALVLLSIERFKSKRTKNVSLDVVESSKCMKIVDQLTNFPPVVDRKHTLYNNLPALSFGKISLHLWFMIVFL